MTILKTLPAGILAAAVLATGAWAQGALQSTAPEPATSPSQAATPPAPSTSPSSDLGPAPTVKITFEVLDRNHDNFISRAEAAASAELMKNFEQLDTNRDGGLDRSEFVSFSRQ